MHCDELVSLPKSMLTNFVGTLPAAKLIDLDRGFVAALAIDLRALRVWISGPRERAKAGTMGVHLGVS